MRWWPATVTNPKTAATFRLLEWFHILGNQSKVSVYEYYTSLTRRTDNIGSSVKASSGCLIPYRQYTNLLHRIAIPLFSEWHENGHTSSFSSAAAEGMIRVAVQGQNLDMQRCYAQHVRTPAKTFRKTGKPLQMI